MIGIGNYYSKGPTAAIQYNLSIFSYVAYSSNIKHNPNPSQHQYHFNKTRSYFETKRYFTTLTGFRHVYEGTSKLSDGGCKRRKVHHLKLMEAYQLQQLNRENDQMDVIFIDCRPPEVTEAKGSIHSNILLGDNFVTIPLKGGDEDEFDNAVDNLANKINKAVDLNKQVTIISYCNKGNWSTELSRYLIDGGISEDLLKTGKVAIESLRGGFDAWEEAGFPTNVAFSVKSH